MGDPLNFPKLRWPIDVRLEKIEDKEILLISCPLGISDKPLGLLPAVAPVLDCFRGQLSIGDIARRFADQGATEDLIRELVQLLDSHLFLASPNFFGAEKRAKDDFLSASTRKASLAGAAYPSTAKELTSHIDSYLSLGSSTSKAVLGPMVSIVSPHIDYRRGGITYGKTYHHLKTEDHDLYILMGTSHQFSRLMFHLTLKGFETPFGTLSCDTEFVSKLAKRYGSDRSFADEILHRKEHSLELQLPFLGRLKRKAKIVPVLIGSFHHMLTSGNTPETFDEYESFVSSFTEVLLEALSIGRRICFVAGVDMAHVGRFFGDTGSLTPDLMKEIEAKDREYLETIRCHDKLALFAHVAKDSDARRICGFPTMYTVLDLLERVGISYETELFEYRQAVNYQTDCAVTFAGLGLYQAPRVEPLKSGLIT